VWYGNLKEHTQNKAKYLIINSQCQEIKNKMEMYILWRAFKDLKDSLVPS